jgi:hypothetical protein
MYEFLSTFAHVISFPFWFFALIFIVGPVTNKLTLEFGRVKRLATTVERWQFGAIGILCLTIAILLVTR